MGIPDTEVVTQYDKAAELYGRECIVLEELIKDFGWPEGRPGWPRAGQWLQTVDGPLLNRKPSKFLVTESEIFFGPLERLR